MNRRLKVLITHECSGESRRAWRALGHDAYSCDLKPAEDASPHHTRMDAVEAIKCGCYVADSFAEDIREPWDIVLMHPECTYINGAGLHWNNRGRGWEKTEAALQHISELRQACGETPYMLENPVGILSTRWRGPDQYVQPYQFGDDASKKTGLWLRGLPSLVLPPVADWCAPRWVCPECKGVWGDEEAVAFIHPKDGKRYCAKVSPCRHAPLRPRWANQTDSGQNRLGPSAERAAIRARTYPGIAKAMAEQWSAYLISK